MRIDKQPWLPVLLALVAAAVLLAGILTKSETPLPVPEISITAAELKGVRELAESNSLSAFRDRLNVVAEQVEGSLAWSDQWRRAGVMWRPGEVLIARDPLVPQRTANLRVGKDAGDAKPLQWAPGLPFANVGFTATNVKPPAPAKLDNIRPGTSLVAVSLRDRQRLLLPVTLGGMMNAECRGWRVQTIPVSQAMTDDFVGGGLFTLQGELVGPVVDCDGRRAVITLDSVARVLDQLRTAQGQVLSAYGMLVSPLGTRAAEHFQQQQGLLLDTVWERWPAAQAGLMPGDILLSVGETRLTNTESFLEQQSALDGGAVVTYLRGGGQRRTKLSRTPSARAAFLLREGQRAATVEEVERGSREFSAGLRAGDELLQAYGPGGKMLNVRELGQATDGVVYLIFRRGDSLRGVLVTP